MISGENKAGKNITGYRREKESTLKNGQEDMGLLYDYEDRTLYVVFEYHVAEHLISTNSLKGTQYFHHTLSFYSSLKFPLHIFIHRNSVIFISNFHKREFCKIVITRFHIRRRSMGPSSEISL